MLHTTGITRQQAIDAARIIIGYHNTFTLDNKCRLETIEKLDAVSGMENRAQKLREQYQHHLEMKPNFDGIHAHAVGILENLDAVDYLEENEGK